VIFRSISVRDDISKVKGKGYPCKEKLYRLVLSLSMYALLYRKGVRYDISQDDILQEEFSPILVRLLLAAPPAPHRVFFWTRSAHSFVTCPTKTDAGDITGSLPCCNAARSSPTELSHGFLARLQGLF
jgi:hypothetical protein